MREFTRVSAAGITVRSYTGSNTGHTLSGQVLEQTISELSCLHTAITSRLTTPARLRRIKSAIAALPDPILESHSGISGRDSLFSKAS